MKSISVEVCGQGNDGKQLFVVKDILLFSFYVFRNKNWKTAGFHLVYQLQQTCIWS